MRLLTIFTLVSLAFSCSKFRNIEQATTTESKIAPLVKAKNINEKFNGNSVKLKVVIPLSQNTLGHYDVEDILAPTCYKEDKNYEACLLKLKKYEEDQKIPPEEKSWLKRFISAAKFDVYNLAIKLGVSKHLKFSFDYIFPELPQEYFKQVRIKKIFFALEECEKADAECIQRQENKPITFDFLEKFFMNLSVIQDHDPLDFIDDPFNSLSKSQFKRFETLAFGNRLESFEIKKDEKGLVEESAFYDLNIARMDNSSKKKRRSQAQNNIRDNGKTFIFNLEKENIQDVKKFFMTKSFSGIINEMTLIGRNLYVELYGPEQKDIFFKKMNEEIEDIYAFGVKEIKGCSNETCTSLNVNGINLVPMIEKSYHFKFDTFFAIKHLDYNDFKFNGYVELEVELDLPM